MNFFEHQEIARAKSGRLIALFATGVLAMCLSIYTVARFAKELILGSYKEKVVYHTNTFGEKESYLSSVKVPFEFWDTQTFIYTVIPTLLIIFLAMLYRVRSLNKSGGDAVATLMGGVLVDPSTTNSQERMLLNVVEEMAIASGMPVPRVYILNSEPTINAFAAGTHPTNSVIAVTKGALDNFNRDELQGVIAHEFSHIFNGDVLLNIRLMGIISGILVLTTIGRILLRSSGRSRSKKTGPLPFIGLALFIIGYLGVFFGRLIKAAVSREREYLADASSVQYTRNPNSIASALYKISEYENGGIRSAYAEETSHMFFDSTIRHFFSWMSTHPPIKERIQRVSPHFIANTHVETLKGKRRPSFKSDLRSNFSTQVTPPAIEKAFEPVLPEKIIGNFGALNLSGLALASFLLESTPKSIIESIHSKEGAISVLLSLLLPTDEKLNQIGKNLIAAKYGSQILQSLEKIEKNLESLSVEKKLMVLEIIHSTLRGCDKDEIQKLYFLIAELIALDKNVSLFEFCVQVVIDKLLEKKKLYEPTTSMNVMSIDVIRILYSMAHSDHHENDVDKAVEDAVNFIFQAAKVNLTNDLKSYKESNSAAPTSQEMVRSLRRMNRLRPKDKEVLLKASAMIAAHNGRLEPEELFQIKALSIAIETPLGLSR